MGKSISLQDLRDKTQVQKRGTNLLGISDAAEAIGLRTLGTKLSIDQLVNDVSYPCILYWDQKHFVILHATKKNKFIVADPAKGLISYQTDEFKRHWISDKINGNEVGVALLLEPTQLFYSYDGPLSVSNKRMTFRKLLNYLWPYRKLVVQLALSLLISSFLQLLLPFLTKNVVDTGINTGDVNFVLVILLAQASLLMGRLITDFARSWILLHISTRINISILSDFLAKLMRLPISFFDSKNTGDILQRMNDHTRIESFLTGSALNIIYTFVNLFIFSIVLAMLNTTIFFVFTLSGVIYSLWVMLFLRYRRELDFKQFDISAREQNATIQIVQGMQEIKLHGVEKTLRWNWEFIRAAIFKLKTKGLMLNQWQQGGARFINEGKNILITFISAKAVIDGQMSLGDMMAVQYIIGQLNSPIEQLVSFLQSWQSAKISMGRLNEVHDRDDEEPVEKNLLRSGFLDPRPVEENNRYASSISEDIIESALHHSWSDTMAPTGDVAHLQGISLSNISFTYPGAGNTPVLKNIHLTIPRGKTTAIVGMSGSGKTTLLKLLLKFYEPHSGTIKINSIPFSEISHQAWRSHCGVVMQESYIFSDTIARNIAVGAEKIDVSRLNFAMEAANVSEFVQSLPLGFNTRIGAEGTGLSVGQKQRLLIARAIYRDPEFIILDEATNSLDANNESSIIKKLGLFAKGKTVIVVAHRLSTVKNADQIVVLQNGEIREKGSHASLIRLKGEYFGLIKNQLELDYE
jgi:ATP-binding cassette subfamily B protein